MIFALIPAGGQSKRMGRPKLSLPLGNRSVLEHVIAAVRDAGIEHILVVVGPHVPELVPLAETAGAQTLLLAEETPDMRATIEQGLRWAEANWQPTAADTWLLIPADHPTLDSSTIQRLLQEQQSHPEHSIFVPTHKGKRGHPTLIAWKHVAAIRKLPAEVGLNVYFRQHADERREVPVTNADVLCDLDTPDDYQRLVERWG